jgi:uncharacterized integral membrane protein (TIGR00698 family)
VPFSTVKFAVVLPGLLLAVLVAAAAQLLHGLLPQRIAVSVGAVLLAVLLGLLLGNSLRLPASTAAGIRFAFGDLLRFAIVLMGASLSLQAVASAGAKALSMVVLLMSLALAVAHLLGRALGVPGKLASLLGVGTAVCGNTAISATAPVIGAADRDISLAIATNTLFGTLAVFLYPLLGRALGLDDAVFGTWAGSAVNDTSQVVATGFAFSESAGRVATTVKLTRNALMVFVIVAMAFAYRNETTRRLPFWAMLRKSVPMFVLGFLALSLLNSLGAIDWLSERLQRPLGADLQRVAKFLTVVALAGVGLATRISTMRQTGVKPVLLGLVTALAVSLASLLLIHWFGPAQV